MTRETRELSRTTGMVLTALFAVLMAVCSWISVPAVVPFTLQTFAVFCAVGFLGGRRGAISVLVYLLLGVVGLPVFAGFSGGVGALLGATGGYLVGFIFLALVYWGITARLGRGTAAMVAGMLAGLLVLYAFGSAWFLLVYTHRTGSVGLAGVLGWCVFPFVIPDLIKLGLAVFLVRRLAHFVRL